MIIQGDNHPSIIIVQTDISEYPSVSVDFSDIDGISLKHWDKSDLTFDTVDAGYAISCPWTQQETMALPKDGTYFWELKALDDDGLVQFWEEARDSVISRHDKTILTGGAT